MSAPAPVPPCVVLLDVDGTLLHVRGAGREAFRRALRAVRGWDDDLEWVNFSGATDLDVLRRILERHGERLDDRTAARFFRRLAVELRTTLAGRPRGLFPGVRGLLRELSAAPGVVVGLVTGNTGPCARLKLEHAGIHGHFVLGAFGHEHADRIELARLALGRAVAHAGGAAPRRIVLVGDTPADIAAARAIGAVAVAVATGAHDREALRRAGADLVLADLADRSALRSLWTGPHGRGPRAPSSRSGTAKDAKRAKRRLTRKSMKAMKR